MARGFDRQWVGSFIYIPGPNLIEFKIIKYLSD